MRRVLGADAERRVLKAHHIRCVLIHEASAEGRRREARAHVQTP